MKTVLIVDDMAFVRKTLAALLTKANYEVVGQASNGQEAAERYQKLRPQLVTMDVVMPVMSGIEAIKRIIAFDHLACVVIISAMGQESLLMEAIYAGAQDYILKPFHPTEVLRTLERVSLFQNKQLEAGKLRI